MKLAPISVLIFALLGGCMPELKSDLPPDRIYWLEVPEVADSPAVDLNLAVVPGLDSDRIWLLQLDQRLNSYAGAYWPDNLAPLLESLLRRALTTERSGLDVYVLIERFFAVEVGEDLAPEVEVRARFGADGVHCRLEAVEGLADHRLRDVVAGHQQGLEVLAAALAQFARTGRCP
jgi:hypothetical protein